MNSLISNIGRHFCIRSVILTATFFITIQAVAQTPTLNDFRTRKANASWNDTDAWQTRKTGVWANIDRGPSNGSNIYIQNGHTMRVEPGAACNDIHIHTSGKLYLDLFGIDLYGKIRSYTGTVLTTTGADGIFYSSQASSVNPSLLSLSGQVAAHHYCMGWKKHGKAIDVE